MTAARAGSRIARTYWRVKAVPLEPESRSERVLPDVDQSSIRARAVSVLQWALLLAAGAFFLLCCDLYIAAFERWLVLIDRGRIAVGLPPPAAGPDWVVLVACGVAVAIPLGLAMLGIAWHRRKWKANLRRVWPEGSP